MYSAGLVDALIALTSSGSELAETLPTLVLMSHTTRFEASEGQCV